jgi:beta-glucosidase
LALLISAVYLSSLLQDMVGSRLPSFTAAEKALLLSTKPDFFFLNTYTSGFAMNGSQQDCGDSAVCSTVIDANGTVIGPRGESSWLYVYPPGIRGILHWVWARYQTPIMVTENGVDVPGESKLSIAHALEDQFRVDYYRGYLGYVQRAVEEGVDLRGYFAWSLLDNFESAQTPQ